MQMLPIHLADAGPLQDRRMSKATFICKRGVVKRRRRATRCDKGGKRPQHRRKKPSRASGPAGGLTAGELVLTEPSSSQKHSNILDDMSPPKKAQRHTDAKS